jgi:hypothetical protein
VRLGVDRSAISDTTYCSGVARELQQTVQATLDRHSPGYPLGRLSGVVAAERARRAARERGDQDPLATGSQPRDRD